MAKAYFIKINGTEDNGFEPIVAAYTYNQYLEVIKMLKENGTPYITWTDDAEAVSNNTEQGEIYGY